MEKLYHNKIAFLKESPKKLFFVTFIFLLFLITVIYISYKVEVYDHYITKGYVECENTCKVVVVVPTEITIQKIKYKNKNWKPKTLSKTMEIDEENVISYYLYNFSNDMNFKDKEIVELNFCYNKQRIIKKFIEKIF